MKEYDPNIFKGIGTVVVDEIHRTSSEVFSRAYFKHVPRYSIGLSATMVRQDGLSKVFKWHCGQVVFKNIKRNDHVTVNCKKYSNDDTKYCREVALFNGTPMVPTMITNIGNFEPRNNFIIDIIKDILEKEPDRCILLLSDRREHLKILKKKIEKQNLARCGLMIGGVKQVDLDYNAEHCQILLGTYALTDTGLDIYKLDTLILATPKNNVIQSVGRILRKKVVDRTYTPLVIDIIDQFSVFPNQFKKRMKYYRSNNFDIISNIDTTDKIQQENVKLKSFAFI
jgi:hypothetical protein